MNELGNTTLYKLMVLYMLEKIDFSMTYSQISDFVLEKGYTDYFTLASAIGELQESHLIHLETIRNTSFYTITEEGEKTLGYFRNRVPLPIREDIDAFIKENKMAIIDRCSVLADYCLRTDGGYEVQCSVLEKQDHLIDMKLTVTDEQMAQAICRQWKNKCQSVYEYVIRELMTE